MMRSALLGCGLVLLALPGAARAQGVTNPADHPAPVTVTIDGQTYHDGLDTLPGYDDEACTPIPNVQYDFASDEIQYYGGDGDLLKTAHWTEWSRISSYDTWKAQQQSGQPTATPTPAPTSSATATPAPSSSSATTTSPSTSTATTTSPSAGTSPSATSRTTAKTPTSGTTTTKRTTEKRTSTSTKRPTPASPTPGPTTQAAAPSAPRAASTKESPVAGAAATAAPAADAAPADVTAAPTAAPAGTAAAGPTTVTSAAGAQAPTKFKLASQRLGAGGDPGDTRLAGVAILAAVFGAAGFGLLFRGFARRLALGRRW